LFSLFIPNSPWPGSFYFRLCKYKRMWSRYSGWILNNIRCSLLQFSTSRNGERYQMASVLRILNTTIQGALTSLTSIHIQAVDWSVFWLYDTSYCHTQVFTLFPIWMKSITIRKGRRIGTLVLSRLPRSWPQTILILQWSRSACQHSDAFDQIPLFKRFLIVWMACSASRCFVEIFNLQSLAWNRILRFKFWSKICDQRLGDAMPHKEWYDMFNYILWLGLRQVSHQGNRK